MCPNCGEIKQWVAESEFNEIVEIIDATKPEGLDKARKYDVTGVPTIVQIKDGERVAVAKDLEELQAILENKSLSDF